MNNMNNMNNEPITATATWKKDPRRTCPCGETRMRGRITETGEWVCWAGHIIDKDGKIAELPANLFAA